MQARVSDAENTMPEQGWAPPSTMDDALSRIFDAYRSDVAEARRLMD
jgi:hypothetical protein